MSILLCTESTVKSQMCTLHNCTVLTTGLPVGTYLTIDGYVKCKIYVKFQCKVKCKFVRPFYRKITNPVYDVRGSEGVPPARLVPVARVCRDPLVRIHTLRPRELWGNYAKIT